MNSLKLRRMADGPKARFFVWFTLIKLIKLSFPSPLVFPTISCVLIRIRIPYVHLWVTFNEKISCQEITVPFRRNMGSDAERVEGSGGNNWDSDEEDFAEGVGQQQLGEGLSSMRGGQKWRNRQAQAEEHGTWGVLGVGQDQLRKQLVDHGFATYEFDKLPFSS